AIGFTLDVEKGLPLSGGQGGSAASAVAAAVAVNELLGSPFRKEALLLPCLEAETAVAGRHADNVAAALYGGVVLIRSLEPLDVVRLPFPDELRIVLAHPRQPLRPEEARACLPRSADLGVAVARAAAIDGRGARVVGSREGAERPRAPRAGRAAPAAAKSFRSRSRRVGAPRAQLSSRRDTGRPSGAAASFASSSRSAGDRVESST